MFKSRKLYPYLILLILALSGILAMSACSSGNEAAEEDEESVYINYDANPLTGVEEGWDKSANDRRIAAFVVENSPDARPQWGMDDPDYSPDVILQGEVEAGITRTLWLYADYTKLPKQIGPMRSARPPYIKFSELFDSIFIHWGQSASKGSYIGANTVFKKDKVDHINGDKFKDKTGAFDRDPSRDVAIEHTAIVYGDKVSAVIKEAGLRTKPGDYTRLSFSPLPWMTTFDTANRISVTYSEKVPENTEWVYDPEDGKYHTENFGNNVTRDNLLVLYDDTEYQDKENYQGQWGYTITYCDYKLAGGKGRLYSDGLVKDIEWYVDGGKLVLVDQELTARAEEAAAARAEEEAAAAEASDGDEGDASEDAAAKASADTAEEAEEPEDHTVIASLKPGKTWIGWISVNNGGSVSDSNEAE